MRKCKTTLTILFTGILLATDSFAQTDSVAAAQHLLLGMQRDTGVKGRMNPDLRAAWFPKAGFGLFIHWGAVATWGGGDISWCMMANKPWDDAEIKPSSYYSLMNTWNPQQWNPDDMIKRAKAAGFQYAVLTTKHHDGYTLWPSKYGDLGTQTKMNGRDLVKPFVEACRKYGLKVGLYYSPPDWWFDRQYRNWSYNGKEVLDMDYHVLSSRVPKPADHDAKRMELVANQVRELLTQYGKIDLIFFDGGKGEISNDEVRKLQPGIIINGRNKDAGDYGDSEGKLPQERFKGWFETCDPVWPNRKWSYVTADVFATTAEILINLVRLRAWGGNYLANMGPEGSGALPPEVKQEMDELAGWMKHSQESVMGVEGGNYPEESKVPVTVGKNAIYAFALPGNLAALRVVTSLDPKKVVLLRTGQALAYESKGGYLWVTIPAKDRTRLPDAVKISF